MKKCEHQIRYTDKNQYKGICKKCSMKWVLKWTNAGTSLIYYNDEQDLNKKIEEINEWKRQQDLKGWN